MRVKSLWTQCIWSDGQHNAFPCISRFNGAYYVSFRRSAGHQNPRGSICVIRAAAADLRKWTLVNEFDIGGDSRDSALCVVGERLHVYWYRKPDTWVSCSADGATWTTPKELDTEFPDPPPESHMEFTSRRRWHFRIRKGPDGAYYSLARCGITAVKNPGLLVYRSEDGFVWKALHGFGEGIQRLVLGGHETDIAFLADGTAVAAIRVEGSQGGGAGMIASSRPPYTTWDGYYTGVRNFGGPALWRTPHGLLLGARSYAPNGCAVCTLWEPLTCGVRELWVVPSGGDCAYQAFEDGPDGQTLMAYYSSHEWPWDKGKDHPANIYLAHIETAPGIDPAF